MHQTNNARCVDLLWRHILSIVLLGTALSVSYSRYCLALKHVCIQKKCFSKATLFPFLGFTCCITPGVRSSMVA